MKLTVFSKLLIAMLYIILSKHRWPTSVVLNQGRFYLLGDICPVPEAFVIVTTVGEAAGIEWVKAKGHC